MCNCVICFRPCQSNAESASMPRLETLVTHPDALNRLSHVTWVFRIMLRSSVSKHLCFGISAIPTFTSFCLVRFFKFLLVPVFCLSRQASPLAASPHARRSREISATSCGYPKPAGWFSSSRIAAPPGVSCLSALPCPALSSLLTVI